MASALNIGGAPASHEQAFAPPASAWAAQYWGPGVEALAVSVGVNGTANGSTLLANAQPIGGQATGAAAGAGSTVTDTASLLSGLVAAAAGTLGSTVSAASSVIAGVPMGQGAASGSLLTSSSSVVSGSAGVSAAVAGATLTVSTSIIDQGPEAGTGTASGGIVLAGTNIVNGPAAASSRRDGEIVAAVTSFENGSVAGSAGPGFSDLIESETGFISGPANGDAIIDGDILVPPTEFMGGDASGDAETETEMMSAPTFLMGGDAFSDSGFDGGAFGDTVETFAALFAGESFGLSEVDSGFGNASGGFLRFQDRLQFQLPSAQRNGTAPGSICDLRASIIAGKARASVNVRGIIATRYSDLHSVPDYRGDAVANVRLVHVSAELQGGIGSGERNLSDEELLIFAEAA